MPTFPPHSFAQVGGESEKNGAPGGGLALAKNRSRDIIYGDLEREESEMTMMNFDNNNRNENATNRSSHHQTNHQLGLPEPLPVLRHQSAENAPKNDYTREEIELDATIDYFENSPNSSRVNQTAGAARPKHQLPPQLTQKNLESFNKISKGRYSD